ncbi:MAG: pilin [Patescibacteria group bacterium]|jgi:amino acid transporter
MTKIRKQIIIFTLLAIIVTGLLPTNFCSAETVFERMNKALSTSDLPTGGSNPDAKAQEIVGKIIATFLSIFGIMFMALMIYGGYKWMMASGREEEVKKAKDTIRAAIIGLIIVMMAYAISYFVASGLQRATTGTSTESTK